MERAGRIKERNVRNKAQGGRGRVYKKVGLTKKTWSSGRGFTKVGNSLERTKVVKAFTITLVQVGIKV